MARGSCEIIEKPLKAGFHLNFGEKMNFCFFSKLATLTI